MNSRAERALCDPCALIPVALYVHLMSSLTPIHVRTGLKPMLVFVLPCPTLSHVSRTLLIMLSIRCCQSASLRCCQTASRGLAV